MWAVALLCVTLALLVHLLAQPRFSVPGHLLGHPAVHLERMIAPELGRELLEFVRREGEVGDDSNGGYPTNIADLEFYNTTHEHVGEARPVQSHGGGVICAHPFLVPSRDKTQCILPGRVDIGRHYVMHGGIEALRESYEILIARVQSFGRYYFGGLPPAIRRLFETPSFAAAARGVCPPHKQHLDPFQYNLILQVPGQTVPTHIDGVYFWGASRFQFPQWLLAAMKFSGLFEDRFVDQVQVVGYLHQWKPAPLVRSSGDFVVWNASGVMHALAPAPLAGTVVDGSKTIHAAQVYDRNQLPPPIDKNTRTVLSHEGSDHWKVTSQDGNVLRNYTTDDLRISIVYRARCFESEQRALEFREQLKGAAGTGGRLSLDEVLATLVKALPAYTGADADSWRQTDRLKLALQILDHYVKYPLPSEDVAPLLALNYCALPRLVPWLAPVLRPVCG